jgi:hypothetical protein
LGCPPKLLWTEHLTVCLSSALEHDRMRCSRFRAGCGLPEPIAFHAESMAIYWRTRNCLRVSPRIRRSLKSDSEYSPDFNPIELAVSHEAAVPDGCVACVASERCVVELSGEPLAENPLKSHKTLAWVHSSASSVQIGLHAPFKPL